MKKAVIIFMLLLTTGCALLSPLELTREPDAEANVTQPPSVELAWDSDPEALVIQVFAGGSGSAPTAALVNELFAAQVWGDGRIIWAAWTDEFQRQVWQGQLSEAEMAALLHTSGAGVEGTPYLPQSGQLTAREIETEAWMQQTALPLWDAAALGVDLQEAAGIWLEGDALLHAWEAVNRNPGFPIVAQDGRYFELHLRLPDVSVMAPR
jgi:hypothetical protein